MIQERVQAHLDHLVSTGAETGLQVAVYRKGDLVVDAVAGTADSGTGRDVTSLTPFFSFSTGKNVSAMLAHLLVARGYLDYETPVADIWPEFGAQGKDQATLRHVLTHTVGLPAMPRQITPRELPEWSRVCESLAAATPLWTPGTEMGYHSFTFGYLVGELARRATGELPDALLREWIAAPLGVEGQLFFAVPDPALADLATLEESPQPQPAPAPDAAADAEPAPDAILAPWEAAPSADLGNDRDILSANIPSLCTATARGLATMFDAMLQGTLIPAEQLQRLSAVAFEGTDRVHDTPARMALGYPIGRIGAPEDEQSRALGWPGGGGSYAFADPDRAVSFALTKNRLVGDFDTATSVANIVMEHLDEL